MLRSAGVRSARFDELGALRHVEFFPSASGLTPNEEVDEITDMVATSPVAAAAARLAARGAKRDE
jgi:hypothetical protein